VILIVEKAIVLMKKWHGRASRRKLIGIIFCRHRIPAMQLRPSKPPSRHALPTTIIFTDR